MTSKQLDFNRAPRPEFYGDILQLETQQCPVIYRRNNQAKRYRLTLGRDGFPRVTIPRRGSRKAAEQFAQQHGDWILRQIRRHEERRDKRVWADGTQIFFRGETAILETETTGTQSYVRFGTERFLVGSAEGNLRPEVEAHLRRLAAVELPVQVGILAEALGRKVKKIVVRAQVSRWGSCSCRGTVSLNWRLIQVPPEVRDYVIIHELTHLREMNHSSRFWTLVGEACPTFKTSEAWLRKYSQALL